MPTNRDRLRRFYDEEHDEWGRLETEVGSYEWATTTRHLAAFLPPPPARVVDIGGGPGRYAIWLAQRGYDVTLIDLSAYLVEQARRRSADAGVSVNCIAADATNLSMLANDSFDAALSLGPFYHLLDSVERDQAADEMLRVCRPAAAVAVMLLNRAAGFLDALASGDLDLFSPRYEALWERIFSEGVYENPGELKGLFIDNYSVWPSETRNELERYGLRTERLVGCEGPLVRFGPALQIAAENQEAWAFMWRQAYRFEEHADWLVLSPHLLWLGRAP